jgi:hypothetical protein
MFQTMNENQLKLFHKKVKKIDTFNSFNTISKTKIRKNIEEIENLTFKNFSSKTKNSIINFLNEENEQKFSGLKTRAELIEKMSKDYEKKSLNQLKFFINNVSSKYNTLQDKPLINWKENQTFYFNLKKNYTPKIDEKNNLFYELEREKKKGEFLLNSDKKYSAKKIAKIYCLEEYIEDENEEYISLFLTFTNPSEFHYYTLKNKKEIDIEAIENEKYNSKKFVKNPQYNDNFGTFENSIILGIENQKEINRYFYKDLKKRIERAKLNANMYHFTIFEPHKSLQPHSHKMLILPRSCINLAHESFNLTKKYFNLKQVKIEEIKEARASTYITKYLLKTLNLDENNLIDFKDLDLENIENYEKIEVKRDYIIEKQNENFIKDNFFNLYRRYFGASNRIFTTSNFKTTTQKKIDIIYKFLKENYPEFLKSLKENKKSLYYQLEKLEEEKIFTFEFKNNENFSFNLELLKTEYKKYFIEEKRKLISIIKKERNKIKETYNIVLNSQKKRRKEKIKDFFKLYREHKRSATYSLEYREERAELFEILNNKENFKLSKIRNILKKINKENQIEYSKNEMRTLLLQKLTKEYKINFNNDNRYSAKQIKKYFLNNCLYKAKNKIIEEIEEDKNILNDIHNFKYSNFEFTEIEINKLIKENILKTKYIYIKENKIIESASFNETFNINTKEAINKKTIYKSDMYEDNKINFVNIELDLIAELDL